MEARESKLPAPFGMDGDQKTEKERLITRKRKRKGTPRKLVLCNENFSISESFQQRPTEHFLNQEGLDLSRTGGEFLPYSLITNAGEDIIAKITSFCESCSCNAYIVSAVGSVARARILQCGNASTYEPSNHRVSSPMKAGFDNFFISGILWNSVHDRACLLVLNP